MANREQLALQVVELAKAAVLTDNHFLSWAVGRLHVAPMELSAAFATDGYVLAFDPGRVTGRFKRTGLPPKRNLLHSVAHCLFLHPYVSASIDQPLWNLACDIAAERVVIDFLGTLPGEKGARIALAIQQIERDMGSRITAEKVYRRLRDGWWADVAGAWMGLMKSDSHELWYLPAGSSDDERGEGTGSGTDSSGNVGSVEGNADSYQPTTGDFADDEGADDPAGETGQGEFSQQPNGNASERPRGSSRDTDAGSSQEAGQSISDYPSGNATVASQDSTTADSSVDAPATGRARSRNKPGKEHGTSLGDLSITVQAPYARIALREMARPSIEQQKDEWRQVATSLAVNLQTLSAKRGGALTGFVDDLRDAAHKRSSYAQFLRQFAIPGEVMRLSEDEFDNVFYTYGLQLYGNVPLIEPLEYREERRVREFVIVIDTSASVQGDIVRSFVSATFDILKETEAFFDHVHLRILQCDTDVRTDDRISCLAELEDWGRSMRVMGGGGTDFRPAFAYVDDLVARGEFCDLGGLVYFTDGFGTYPASMPGYRTAFVFYDEDPRETQVPPWAVQIVLDMDDMNSGTLSSGNRINDYQNA